MTPIPVLTLPPFPNMRARCARCGNTGDILLVYDRECSGVTGEHFHRRCMKCRHRWAEQTSERPKALALRVLGHDVELACACGLVLVQPLRAAIHDRCPKCRRWRR